MINKEKTTDTPIVIDCQVFQSFAWQRGMGKYSSAFLQEVLKLPEIKSKNVYFLFNNNAEDNPEATRMLKAACPGAELIKIELLTPKEPREENSVQVTRLENKKVLNSKLQEYFGNQQKFDFLILAAYLDEVCSVFPDHDYVNDKLLIYYDSIPYLYHQRYGQFKGFFDNFYLPHTATVFEATKILTISQTVANDLNLYFGIPKERIFNINGASIPRSAERPKKPANLDLKKNSFVLMPSGQEIRKNNSRAVQGFHNFVAQANEDLHLVATSHFTSQAKKELKRISSRIIFTDNVSEGELLWLYQNCRYLLFASEYEGLGLPVLEAVEQNKLVACSDISVFREMSQDAFYFFDPLDVESITVKLHETEKEYKNKVKKKDSYRKIVKKYSWKNTAHDFAVALGQTIKLSNTDRKKKIAIFCPDPSGFSAIGKVVAESHAWYSEYFDIDYYFDVGPNHIATRPNFLQSLTNCYLAEEFRAEDAESYDAIVYHIGNSEYHLNIIRTALVLPGYVILHDTNLGGAYHNLLEQGYITPQRYQLEEQLDRSMQDTPGGINSTYLTSIINNQHAVITHSEYSRQAVQTKMLRKVPIVKLELPVDTPMDMGIIAPREHKQITLSFAGIIAKIKGVELIESIAQSDDFMGCQINIFGFSMIDPEQLKSLRHLPHVNLKTNPTDFEYQRLLSDTDILVNVRLAYKGETSLTTLEHMRYGGIVLVRDFGWYSELPDDSVIKVAKPEDTLRTIRQIINNPGRREILMKKALDYINANHTHKAYAQGMFELINNKPFN